MKKFHILVLIDIGGTLMYRGEVIKPTEFLHGGYRPKDYCVRNHYHYYRPFMDSFLAQLLEHERIQLAFYSNITRKNVMPLLYHMFG